MANITEIKKRIGEHLSDIKNYIPLLTKKPVAIHFNLKNHDLKEHFSFFVLKIDISNDLIFEYENEYILFFSHFHLLMNDYINNHFVSQKCLQIFS